MLQTFFKKILKKIVPVVLASALILLVLTSSVSVGISNAATTDELQQQIDQRNTSIKALEQEIATYQDQINQTSAQSATLQNAIKVLDTTRKSLDANISLTGQKIDAASLTIDSLGDTITLGQKQVETDKLALAKSLKMLQENDIMSPVEMFLKNATMSSLWTQIEQAEQFQQEVSDKTDALLALTTNLTNQKQQSETKRNELQQLKGQLSDQQKIVQGNKSEEAKLLADTQDKESNYKKIVTDKVALKTALEQEILNYESQLNLAVDPNSIPPSGAGVLHWPLDKIVVTQQFGDTDFSRQNPWAYNGKGHNGVDFAAAIGTPVKAALDGFVKGTGNTDTVCPKASYGNWVLIQHANGLSTLYAHLSLIKVSTGQTISTGQLVGYSGNTGYTTGPHLHFGVYATEGVEITKLQSKVCSGAYTLPVADLKAYLNPLLYL